jgi:hypothetical protein
VAVNFYNGTVNHDMFQVGFTGQSAKNAFENIGFNPITEPLEYRVPFPELRWKIAPGAVCSGDPQNRFQKKARITACPARITLSTQTMWLHQFPHPIRDNVALFRHPKLPFRSVNQDLANKGILNLNRP